MTLTANQLKSDWLANRMKWIEEKGEAAPFIPHQFENINQTIEIYPMEIRTFFF